jgi:alpha-beta hydrolase superfamily lysophospholipase
LLLIVNGGGWHSGYFEDLAAVLNKANIVCASSNQVNCGYSDPEPDSPKPGVMHVCNFECIVEEDGCTGVDWMQKEAGNTEAPVILLGESFGGLQVRLYIPYFCLKHTIMQTHTCIYSLHQALMAAAFDKDGCNCKIDGLVCSGGLLEVGSNFLPPKPVMKFLIFLANYCPRVVMLATDFESTFDDAFGDKDWAKTTRADPKISMEIKATIGAVAATLSSGDMLKAKAKDFPIPFFAVHGKGDVRTSCAAMEE